MVAVNADRPRLLYPTSRKQVIVDPIRNDFQVIILQVGGAETSMFHQEFQGAVDINELYNSNLS